MMIQPQIEGRSWLDERDDFNAWVAGRLKRQPGTSGATASERQPRYFALSMLAKKR